MPPIVRGGYWRCHVCGDERPDEVIDTCQREEVVAGGGTFTVSVRYCTDRAICEAVAPVVALGWLADVIGGRFELLGVECGFTDEDPLG